VVNHYLVGAFSLAWLLFGVYAWSLSRRQERLKNELDELKKRLESSTNTA
jgi:CcmD family protein